MLRSEELKQHKEEFLEHTICGIFHKTALRYPDHIAVEDEEGAVTYRELDEYSNFLAKHLKEQGTGPEKIVALQSGRHRYTIIGMMAAWKAGGAYIFLDEMCPASRNQYLKEECGCKIVLTQQYLAELGMERLEEYVDDSKREGLAIIIFTSGSTAKPKGVMIEHRNIMAAVSNFHRLGFCDSDRTSVFPSFSFVASVCDICSSLAVGAALEIIPEYRRRSIDLIIEYCKEKSITIQFLPPHMAMKLMKRDQELKLRALLVGSEAVRYLEKKDYRIINVYASSEMCSLISAYDITTHEKSYPIGTINPTLRYYIVDDDGNQVEPGEEGELWLAGAQVTRGYLNKPEQTARQFIDNPFSADEEFKRLYKTHDIVCQQPDGNLKFICRKDDVYKIRGFKVGAAAVEEAMLKCPLVKEAAVKAFEDSGGCNILCGYFSSDEKADVKKIKEELKKALPYYMVPTCMIAMDRLPRNSNNKIDRKALEPPAELNDHKLLEKLY